MRNVEFSAKARASLAEIEDYIANQANQNTAKRVVDKIVARCQRLADLPGLFGTARNDLADDLRSTPYQGYILYFRYSADKLQIVSILNARRDALAYFGQDDDD